MIKTGYLNSLYAHIYSQIFIKERILGHIYKRKNIGFNDINIIDILIIEEDK
jgi:hypothetical protein